MVQFRPAIDIPYSSTTQFLTGRPTGESPYGTRRVIQSAGRGWRAVARKGPGGGEAATLKPQPPLVPALRRSGWVHLRRAPRPSPACRRGALAPIQRPHGRDDRLVQRQRAGARRGQPGGGPDGGARPGAVPTPGGSLRATAGRCHADPQSYPPGCGRSAGFRAAGDRHPRPPAGSLPGIGAPSCSPTGPQPREPGFGDPPARLRIDPIPNEVGLARRMPGSSAAHLYRGVGDESRAGDPPEDAARALMGGAPGWYHGSGCRVVASV